MPRIRFLYIGSHVCSTLLSNPASRRRSCASLSLHLHQVVKRTFTFKLSIMLGTHKYVRAVDNADKHERGWTQIKSNFYEKLMRNMLSKRKLAAIPVQGL